jgi:preprotein translocase subunit SecY
VANSTVSNPTALFADAGRLTDIRSRLFFLLGALLVYRIGTFIPVPGINPSALARYFNDQ